jgi:hypothetical protein
MADFLGIPARRLPLAVALVAALAFAIYALQGRFNQADVKKAISLALSQRPSASSRSVFEALVARGEGDPRCDGRMVSQLLGDVEVRCSTPGAPDAVYEFRVLLEGKRPPRAASPPARALLEAMAHEPQVRPAAPAPPPPAR